MKTDDLLMDDRFVQWVLHPNEELDYYWNQWMLDHPNDTGAAHDARTFIQKIYKQEAENLQEASLVSIKDRAWERVKRSVQYDVLRPKRLWGAWRQVAAAVLILAVLAALFIYKPSKTGGKNYAYNGVVYENRGKQLSKKNVSNSASTVYLPDGSRVILDPGAGIEYEALLNGEHRIITLKGSAFFDVAKDSSRPFIIHTTKADVRVLGTSFKIRETPQNGNITVAVRTGKVMVSGNNPKKQMIQLLPGEQVSVGSSETAFAKTIVNDPSSLAQPAVNEEHFEYDNVNIAVIIKELEKVYGVEIDFDEAAFKGCFLTTSLSSGSLYNKLDILTAATGAAYALQNGKIQMTGGGKCN
ncbi:MAG TPA: FecR domain-containing protein [Niabella sp.]